MISPSSAASFSSVSLASEDSASINNSKGMTVITQFQTDHGFRKISSTGVQTNETSDFVIGQQSLKLTTDGHGSPAFTRRTNISPSIDLTNKTLAVWIKVSDTSNIRELRVTVTGDKFQTFRNYWMYTSDGKINASLSDNKWTLVTISPENIRDFGKPDMSKINAIQLRVVDKGQDSVSVWFNSLSSTETNSNIQN